MAIRATRRGIDQSRAAFYRRCKCGDNGHRDESNGARSRIKIAWKSGEERRHQRAPHDGPFRTVKRFHWPPSTSLSSGRASTADERLSRPLSRRQSETKAMEENESDWTSASFISQRLRNSTAPTLIPDWPVAMVPLSTAPVVERAFLESRRRLQSTAGCRWQNGNVAEKPNLPKPNLTQPNPP